MWLAGDVMLEVGVIWLRRLLGLEGGFVASRGSDTGRQVSSGYNGCWGWREDVWLAGEVILGDRCLVARMVVGAGGRMCG